MKDKISKSNIDYTANSFIKWIGSFSSLLVHTLLFLLCFITGLIYGRWDTILLILTTVVSLEAIYLAIFIQMSINMNSESLQAVEKDIEEIAEDVEEIAEDVEELNEDDAAEETQEEQDRRLLKDIQDNIIRISQDLEKLKKTR